MFRVYLTDSRGVYPAAYLYVGHKITGTVQEPDKPIKGYLHWSSYLYANKSKAGEGVYRGVSGWDAFMCPSLENGGLPPTNPAPEMKISGQVTDPSTSGIDEQAPRCAYTVNEALMPRNKFVRGFQGSVRPYRYVNQGKIKQAADTVLATEFWEDWTIVSEVGYGEEEVPVVKSHRPVHGFRGASGELDISKVAADPFAGRKTIYEVTTDEVRQRPQGGVGGSKSRLDWIGRNHGIGSVEKKKSNFLYADGHVETKSIEETIKPFQWGQSFYSLEGGDQVLKRN